MNPTSRLAVGESPPARPCVAPTDPPESFTLRHRHRPWVAHQKLVAVSFIGDVAVVLLALVLAYMIRFETGLREIGVADSAISVSGYCGHVLLGAALLVFLLANSRIHDPRNFLAVRKTFAGGDLKAG